jgi:endonuclease/exonuclease/phosphatase family metal-dependent hydrolase
MEICLITCNIRFDNPADGANSWKNRRDFLSQTLLKYNPSLIATQEGRYHQISELNLSLESFQIIDQHRSWIGERMYPTLFAKQGVFEHLASGDLWLSETPEVAGSLSFNSTFPRLMTWTRIQLKGSEENILIVNTHLDHVKQETRIEQAKVLVNQIHRLWDQKSALIIMGDFNDSPDSSVMKIIFKEFPFLNDAWRQFNSNEETSHHAFKGEIQNGSRIDWILIDKKFTIQSCLMDKSNLNGLYPTDHFPVICQIKI